MPAKRPASRSAPKPRTVCPIVDSDATVCPKCGSSRRTEYHGIRTLEASGVDRQGRPYSATVWKHATCLDCGQSRVDRSHVYEPQPAAP